MTLNKSISNWFNLRQLTETLKHESRYVLLEPHKSFVESVVNATNEHMISFVPKDTLFYRARINDIDFTENKSEGTPFPPEEMGPPPPHFANSGRVNPVGIPCLYCAGELDTAGSELRPWKGANLTIGEVTTLRDIEVADLTLKCKDEQWEEFFYDFAELFSIPSPPKLKLNYLVTQVLSEHFKASGIRGIKYQSDFNNGGTNYALFHQEDYKIIKTFTVEASEVSYFFF